jgi:hypothetical protein
MGGYNSHFYLWLERARDWSCASATEICALVEILSQKLWCPEVGTRRTLVIGLFSNVPEQ